MNSYDLGTLVRLDGSFTDATGAAIDPTTVTLRTKGPDGTVTSYTGVQITKDSTGNYHCDVTPASSGVWSYRWEGTGAAVVAKDWSFYVTPSSVVAG